MKEHRQLILCVIIIFLSACDDSDSDKDPNYRFYVEYTNHSWGFVHKGLFIDNNGEVYYFNLEQQSDLDRDGNYTEQELDDLFSQNQSYLTTIDSTEFQEMVRLSERVQVDQMTDLDSSCADAGVYQYSTFHYDKNTETYSDLLLYQTGDWGIENHNPSAIILRDWLIDLALEYNVGASYGFCTGVTEE